MGTIFLGSFDNEAVRFDAEYNDNNLRIGKITCANNSGSNARVTLLEDGIIAYQVTFGSGITSFNISGQKMYTSPAGDFAVPFDVLIDYPVP